MWLCLFVGITDPEYAVLRVSLNEVDQGDRFVLLHAQRVWLKSKDLQDFGLRRPEALGEAGVFDGETWIAVPATPDLNAQELHLVVDALQFRVTTLDMKAEEDVLVTESAGVSAFLNYGIELGCQPEAGSCEALGVVEGAIAVGGVALFCDGYCQWPEGACARGGTFLVRDFPSSRVRLQLGDVLGGGVLPMGGVAVGTAPALAPYYLDNPQIRFATATTTPSTVEVYRNGVLLRREHVPPGPVAIDNIPPLVGETDVTVVVRDAFGRIAVQDAAFVRVPSMLAAGAQQWSVQAGLRRASATYREAAILAAYRRGLLDMFTAGLEVAGDRESGIANLQLQTLLFDRLSVLGQGAWSIEACCASSVALQAFWGRVSLAVEGRRFPEGMRNLQGSEMRRDEMHATMAVGPLGSGRVRFGGGWSRWWDGSVRQNWQGGYSWTTAAGWSMQGTLSIHASVLETRGQFLLTITRPLPDRLSAFAQLDAGSDGDFGGLLQAQRSYPFGEGVGGFARVVGRDIAPGLPAEAGFGFDAQAGVRHRRGVVELQALRQPKGPLWLMPRFSGGLLFVDGAFAASRSVAGSFALVDTGLAGVRVLQHHQEM
jgi:outer membrane usher protein